LRVSGHRRRTTLMSQPNGVPPFRVVYSGLCRDAAKQLLTRAAAAGRFASVAQAMREVHTQLEWIPQDFGELLRDLLNLGLVEHIGAHAPLVVRYCVDEVRRIVYVTLPFKLLPNSGL